MRIAVFILTLLATFSSQAQDNSIPTLSNLIPSSPNATALAKFGEIPVGKYTGIPSINIPLYEINTGKLSLPISLNYHGGGVKVEDIASWVGIGWSLNAGGAITRQIRGIADEAGGGYLQTYDKIGKYLRNQMSATEKDVYFRNISEGTCDSQQDIFYYNFGNDAGSFLFDSTGTTVGIPNSKYKIEFGNFFGIDNCWKITDISGNTYYFLNKETTNSLVITNNTLPVDGGQTATTSWYLSKIYNPSLTDSIIFTYDHTFNTTNTNGVQTKYLNNTLDPEANCPPKTDISYSSNILTSQRLKEISFNNGNIFFNISTEQRFDYPGDYPLNSIVIKNSKESVLRSYHFYQSYQTSNGQQPNISQPEQSRLYLDSLSLENNTNANQWYKFSYYNRRLPSRRSYNQDHWGYYNGSSNGNVFVPTTNLWNSIFPDGTVIPGANRNPDINYAIYGTLSTIKYPSGGKTIFEYESNTANNLNYLIPGQNIQAGTESIFVFHYAGTPLLMDTTFVIDDNVNATYEINPGSLNCGGYSQVGCPVTIVKSDNGFNSGNIRQNGTAYLPKGTYHITSDLRTVIDSAIIHNYVFSLTWQINANTVDSLKYNAPVGGLRIKILTDYTSENTIASTQQYKYLYPDSLHYSSGHLLSFPQYVGSVVLHKSIDNGKAGVSLYTCNFLTISSQSTMSLISDQGSYATYKYVQVLRGKNGEFGKEMYEYTSADDHPDIVYGEFPFPPSTSRSWKRGNLLHEWDYRYNSPLSKYELVKETINRYNDITSNIYQSVKIGQSEFFDNAYMANPVYITSQYSTEAGWFPLISDTVRIYNPADLSRFVQTVNNYTYNASYLPAKIVFNNSKGEQKSTFLKYSSDYTITGMPENNVSKGIKNLQTKNIILPVIEKYKQISNMDGSNLRTVGGYFTTYKPDVPLPDSIFTLEFPDLITNFSPASITASTVSKNSNYKPRLLYNSYDAKGNIAQQQKINDINEVYLWGYRGQYPVAKIAGSDWNTVKAVINQTLLDSAANYTDTQIRTELNKLRNAVTLNGAQITTYTYAPLIGMTSETNSSGITTYYEYDGLGRLNLIRDQDGNILKKICYNYAGQQGECSVYLSDAINADYSSQNCSPSTESPVAYHVSVPQGMFTSSVDQTTANLLAQQYAQNQANQYGTCQINNISVYADDEVGSNFSITLHNAGTGQDYSFNVYAHDGSTLDNVPQGNYDITITPLSSTGWYNYSVGCGYYDAGPGGSTVTFYGVPLSAGCNSIEID